jgi:hypothetical protein
VEEDVEGSTGGSVIGRSTLKEIEMRGPSVVVGVGSGVCTGVSEVVVVSDVVGSGIRGGKEIDINGGASVVVTTTSDEVVESVEAGLDSGFVGGSDGLAVSDEVSVDVAVSVVDGADTVITVGGPSSLDEDPESPGKSTSTSTSCLLCHGVSWPSSGPRRSCGRLLSTAAGAPATASETESSGAIVKRSMLRGFITCRS